GPRPPGTTTWLRGARCTDPKATARRCRTAGAQGDGSAAPRPKTATVERREASVPRHGTQGARKRLACRVANLYYMALYTTPSRLCKTVGSRILILWLFFPLHGPPLLYLGPFPARGAPRQTRESPS